MSMNIGIAFWAGLASFISPCCLPLYPSYLSYLTGISVTKLKSEQTTGHDRRRVLTHALFFVIGFSIVFYSLGFGAGLLAEWFVNYKDMLRQIAALLILVMGLFLLGVIKPEFLLRERKLNIRWKPAGYAGSVLLGVGFAAGWSPCVGPILASIIALASSEPGTWFSLMTAYSLGFAIPFLALAFFVGTTKVILRYSNIIMRIGGVLMIVVSILLFTDYMLRITIWLNSITPDWMLI